jgi:hypothetical protein
MDVVNIKDTANDFLYSMDTHKQGMYRRYFQNINIGGSTTRITTTNTNTNKYNGGTINTPSLTINSVQQSDAGTYTCFGSNSNIR